MLSKTKLWDRIDKLVVEAGFKLFDLEMPTSNSKAFNIFITSKVKGEAVQIENCLKVNKAIKLEEDLYESLNEYSVQVSSPGVNRRLTREEHFSDAIGENVKIVIKYGDMAGQAFTGELVGFSEDSGEIKEEAGNIVSFNLSDLKSARVDFKF